MEDVRLLPLEEGGCTTRSLVGTPYPVTGVAFVSSLCPEVLGVPDEELFTGPPLECLEVPTEEGGVVTTCPFYRGMRVDGEGKKVACGWWAERVCK